MIVVKNNLFTYPTESFYALGADATDPQGIKQLFRVKHREPGKPIALIAADLPQVKKFFYLSATELRLAKKYWPGPLTILLRPKQTVAANALFPTTPPPLLKKEGTRRIGIRVPAHAGARRLAATIGVPISATSANLSGQPPTKSAIRVKRLFPDILIMPGKCGRAIKPSTIIMINKGQIKILRAGSIKLK